MNLCGGVDKKQHQQIVTGVLYLGISIGGVEDTKADVVALGAELPGERASFLANVQLGLKRICTQNRCASCEETSRWL